MRRSQRAPLQRQAAVPRVGRGTDDARAEPSHCSPADGEVVTRPGPSRRRTITNCLRHQISSGHFKPAERLPSEAQLAARCKVSTSTLRSAFALFQGEDLVEKIHGHGNLVHRPFCKITHTGGAAAPVLSTTFRHPAAP
ncbi:winged helix-turn-helix domain-containing protein [Streptomyces goshikiensis]|uniref:winged helix-turn-helix domain-containing protein n=1 Tax=Streptomyces goshikiensis TaxID=1942 RepID=UPI0036C08B34